MHAARRSWDEAIEHGNAYGYPNAQHQRSLQPGTIKSHDGL